MFCPAVTLCPAVKLCPAVTLRLAVTFCPAVTLCPVCEVRDITGYHSTDLVGGRVGRLYCHRWTVDTRQPSVFAD